ncbi:hypothetical protein RB195_022260 [Necator americanus]|uniref:Reverse transcriptase domain-containing protein n=1 Tax=Necator americanus TaxID=51031 RepID=A0ABR1EEK7_NECAM
MTGGARTSAGFTSPFEIETELGQGAVTVSFLFNFAVDDIMRRTVEQCSADIVLALSECPLTELEYDDDVVVFASSKAKLQHVIDLESILALAYGLRLLSDKSKQV